MAVFGGFRVAGAILWLIPVLGAQTVALTPLSASYEWSVEISNGKPNQPVSRAAIVSIPGAPGFLLHDQAAAALQRSARDSAPARLSTAGGALVGLCSGGVVYGGTRIHSNAAKATWAGIGLAGAGAGCLIWQLFHQQVVADVPNAAPDIAHLLPDAGIVLDASGSWSGLLVAAGSGGTAVRAQLPQ